MQQVVPVKSVAQVTPVATVATVATVAGSYKYILTWCEAYGGKNYGWRLGSDRFIEAGCAQPNCYLTSNRSLLDSVAQFDAIMFHQRSFSWRDAPNPEERRAGQRYIHWMFESPAHLNYDITPLSELSNYFNWSMTYRLDSTFPAPYGSFENIAPHPRGPKLSDLIRQFGKNNPHLASKVQSEKSLVTWFVSNC